MKVVLQIWNRLTLMIQTETEMSLQERRFAKKVSYLFTEHNLFLLF